MKLFTKILSLLFIIIYPSITLGQGGMWPVYMLQDKANDMKAAGLQIPVNNIYDPSAPALNDAVVLFGGGCTGEVVSKHGLIFTNHHCGYSYGQSLSSKDRNILIDGFWAKNIKEELPCPGLEVQFVKEIINVTDNILSGVTFNMSEAERNKRIQDNIKALENSYKRTSTLTAVVKSYFDGNEYWAEIRETFKDVRMVGFPPNGIGKFGGDTDNWMWPRHTGDFAVFRVYANKNNQPAAYSANNVPYKPKKYFPIQTKGYKEDDLSMVYGFPFRTTQYLSSFQVKQIQEIIDPIRINARSAKLAIWDEAMRKDSDIFLKYASKQSSISNGWKKWQGEIRGLEINDVIGKKQAYESKFQQLASAQKGHYEDVLLHLEALVTGNDRLIASNEIINETVLAIEIISASNMLHRMMTIYRNNHDNPSKAKEEIQKIEKSAENFYKNYDVTTDMKVFDTLMHLYFKAKDINEVPAPIQKLYRQSGYDMTAFRNAVFDQSTIANKNRMLVLLDHANANDSIVIKNDPAYIILSSILDYKNEHINPKLNAYNLRLQELSRQYTQGQRLYNISGKKLYPDANQSLRLTYGPIKGIQPFGTDEYAFQTNLDQVIDKTNPAVEEFNTPHALIQLYQNKDYGRWAENGTVPVAFVSQNHTSGGNSGSPVLNAKGELIGINFDRIWDGTMSDIYYDPNLCRNIAVDIRYVMFVIEKLGKADWLFKEMDLR